MSSVKNSEEVSSTQPEASTSKDVRPKTPTQPTPPVMDKSPLLNRRSGTYHFASQNPKVEKTRTKLHSETNEHIIGPMPVGTYLDKFLPMNGEPLELGGFDFKSVLYDTDGKLRKELQMYEPFITVVNGMQLSIKLSNTASTPDKPSGLKVDVGVFKDEAGGGFDDMESWIEFKLKGADPFQDEDTNKPFIRESLEAKSAVGQLISYAAVHMGSSFRTHTFSVLIFGNMARLMRWDRAGVVVSESFDYTVTNHLVDFLKRFDRLTPEQRGTDMSVTVPDEVEGEMAKAALLKEENFNSQEFENTKIRKFAVPHDDRMKYFVGWIPSAKELSVVGRNSRGAPVYDIETGDVRWLKDTWRPDGNGLDAEAKSYNTLHIKECRNIIGIAASGDVCSLTGSVQTTITDTLITEDWVRRDDKVKKIFQKYVHYRLVLDEVGRDLTSFKSTRELLGAIINAIEALIDAYFKADILHRDISPRNIVITKDGKGKLIDWDLCRPRNRTGAYTQGYTGTWQFVSGLLLQDPYTKHHDLADDLESVLHVLTWTLVCYSESTLNEVALLNFLSMYDEEVPDTFNPNRSTGGRMKADKLGRPGAYLPEEVDFKTRPGLANCIQDIAHLFLPLYTLKKYLAPDQKEKIIEMVESLEKNGGVQMAELIRDLLKEADVLKRTEPEKWPADDKAEKKKVYVQAGSKKEQTSYSKLSSSKRNRSRQNTNHQSSRVSVEPMQSLKESDDRNAQARDEDEDEDIEEDRIQKKARMAHK